ncbi:MAG: preprotein translocase subunit YajC [Actinomycetota bacterium]|nr:preprotein translocase subunit YajC [Actinomycetota bacterium]
MIDYHGIAVAAAPAAQHLLLAAATKAKAAAPQSSPFSSLLLIGVFVLIAYFLLMRPGKNRARAQRAMHESMSVGDQVVTNGGLVGEIVEEAGDRLIIEVAPDVTVAVMRQYVVQRIPASPASDNEALDASGVGLSAEDDRYAYDDDAEVGHDEVADSDDTYDEDVGAHNDEVADREDESDGGAGTGHDDETGGAAHGRTGPERPGQDQ